MSTFQTSDDDFIKVPTNIGLKIPNTSIGLVKGEEGSSTTDGDLSPEEMERIANEKLNNSSDDNSDDNPSDKNKDKPTDDGIKELEAKYKADPKSLSDKELNLLKESGVELDNSSDEPNDEEIEARLKEIDAKSEEELTDEDKEFIEKYSQEEPELIQHVQKSLVEAFGIKLPEDSKFSNDNDGLVNLVKEVGKQVANASLLNHIESDPNFAKFYKHTVIDKKSIDTFLLSESKSPFEDVKLSDISDDNSDEQNTKITNTQKEIITAALKAKGNDDDEIQGLIETFEDKGTLFEKAKQAKEFLKSKHDEKVQAKLQEEEAAKQAELQEIQKEWNDIRTMLNKNDLGDGLKIPAADLRDFAKAISEPVDAQGNTRIDYLRSKQTLGQRLFADYLLLKGYKLPGITEEATKSRTLSFKQKKKENEDRQGRRTSSNSGGNVGGSNSKMSLGSLNFNSIQVK